jgi:hypothetical protein
MRILGLAEIIAEQNQNLLLNDLSRSPIRYDPSSLQRYLTARSIPMNIFSGTHI